MPGEQVKLSRSQGGEAEADSHGRSTGREWSRPARHGPLIKAESPSACLGHGEGIIDRHAKVVTLGEAEVARGAPRP